MQHSLWGGTACVIPRRRRGGEAERDNERETRLPAWSDTRPEPTLSCHALRLLGIMQHLLQHLVSTICSFAARKNGIAPLA